MPRTDISMVGEVIEVDPEINLDPFILIANELVTECCTGDAGPTVAYTSLRLTVIETWLAAHFYSMRDKPVGQESAAGVGQTYKFNVAMYLANTLQGQTALALDTNGGLAALSKALERGGRRRVGITWLGVDRDNPPVVVEE